LAAELPPGLAARVSSSWQMELEVERSPVVR